MLRSSSNLGIVAYIRGLCTLLVLLRWALPEPLIVGRAMIRYPRFLFQCRSEFRVSSDIETNQSNHYMKKFIYSLLPLFIVILSGCSKKDNELDFIKVTSGLTYTVEAAGGTVNVNVETNTDYFVSIPDDAKSWISVVESRASRNETISLSVSENGIDARSTIVYINNKNGEQLAKIQISQKGEDPCFNVKNGSTVEVESKGGTIDLKFETNIE